LTWAKKCTGETSVAITC